MASHALQHVEEHLAGATPHRQGHRADWGQTELQPNSQRTHFGPDHRDHPLNDAVDVERHQTRLRRCAEREQILHQCGEAVDLALDHTGVLAELGPIGEPRLEQLRGALDPGEGIAHLVREAGHHGAEARQALVAMHRLLQRLLVAEVVNHQRGAGDAVVGVPQRQTRDAHRNAAAVAHQVLFAARLALALRFDARHHVGDEGRLGGDTRSHTSPSTRLRLADELFGCLVEQHDVALAVHDDDGVVERHQHVGPWRRRASRGGHEARAAGAKARLHAGMQGPPGLTHCVVQGNAAPARRRRL
jgi:hypothetical protein